MIYKLGNNKDKFGYYKVGNFKTYSKVEAIEIGKKNNQFPDWVFNEREFISYDWKTEPSKSLTQLYLERAEDIRKTYDYIVILYSGGADSNNILSTFVDNNIKFEEILTLNYKSVYSNHDSIMHEEHKRVSYPTIKLLYEKKIDFKHRDYDLGDISKKILQDRFYDLNRPYYAQSNWGTFHLAKSYLREEILDYKKIIESGKKLVFVWGCDKPRLYKINNKFCIKFLDVLDTCRSIRTSMLQRDWEYDEFFYWAPECGELIIKQAHTLMNFFKKYQIYSEKKFYSEKNITHLNLLDIFKRSQTDTHSIGQLPAYNSYRNLINTLIYPKFDPRTFSVGKPTHGLVYNSYDQAFWNDAELKKQTELICSHFKTLDPIWLQNPKYPNRGLVAHISKPYFLE